MRPQRCSPVGRRCVHHHDPPWHRERFAHITELPATDPAWRHVAINRILADELAERGIDATVIHNAFPEPPASAPPSDAALRARGARRGRPRSPTIWSSPTRSGRSSARTCRRRSRLAEALGATYWLLGPAEEGYQRASSTGCWRAARCRVRAPPLARDRGHLPGRGPHHVPVDLGGLRQPAASRRRCTAARSASATTRSPPSCGRSASTGSPPTTSRASGRRSQQPDSPDGGRAARPQPADRPRVVLARRTWPRNSPRCWMRQAGRRERPRPGQARTHPQALASWASGSATRASRWPWCCSSSRSSCSSRAGS